jgi:hypothetical protein
MADEKKDDKKPAAKKSSAREVLLVVAALFALYLVNEMATSNAQAQSAGVEAGINARLGVYGGQPGYGAPGGYNNGYGYGQRRAAPIVQRTQDPRCPEGARRGFDPRGPAPDRMGNNGCYVDR